MSETDRKTSTKAEKTSGSKGKPAEYFVTEHSSGWHARPRGIFTGNLFYDQSSNSYDAISFVKIDLLAKAPKGFRNSQDSPATGDGRMKSEFLSLAYMRLLSRIKVLKDQNPDLLKINIFSRFRNRAIIAAIKEMELESGKSISQKARKNADALKNSDTAFKQWFQLRLHEIWEKENAADVLERYAQWLRAIDRAFSEPSDPDEARFLRSLEAAASKCGRVPTTKAVETEFNRHRSANQVGAGSTFRTIKKRLGFNWLPGAKPGPAT